MNMAECPIPEKMDIGSLVGNITKSLNGEGFNGRSPSMLLMIYSTTNEAITRPEWLLVSYEDAQVLNVRHPAPAKILLILKDIEECDEVIRAFELVTRKRYNCMLAQQVDSKVLHHFSVDRAWVWGTLSSGGPALSPRLDDTATSSSHSQEFSALQEQVSANEIEATAWSHLPP